MFSKQLKKILLLSKQTGDRVIIYDSQNPDDAYVVSHLDDYLLTPGLKKREVSVETKGLKESDGIEETVFTPEDLTEADLTDKINQEILKWKTQEEADKEELINKRHFSPRDAWNIPSEIKDKAHDLE